MKVLKEGHLYELENLEVGNGANQIISFIEKGPINIQEDPEHWENGMVPSAGTMKTIRNGTSNEDVLKVLINRMQNLQAKFPCRENSIVITNLEESLMWLEKRTRDRQLRNVEGKHLA